MCLVVRCLCLCLCLCIFAFEIRLVADSRWPRRSRVGIQYPELWDIIIILRTGTWCQRQGEDADFFQMQALARRDWAFASANVCFTHLSSKFVGFPECHVISPLQRPFQNLLHIRPPVRPPSAPQMREKKSEMKPEAAFCCTRKDGICERPAGGMSVWKRRVPCQRSGQGTQSQEEKDEEQMHHAGIAGLV